VPLDGSQRKPSRNGDQRVDAGHGLAPVGEPIVVRDEQARRLRLEDQDLQLDPGLALRVVGIPGGDPDDVRAELAFVALQELIRVVLEDDPRVQLFRPSGQPGQRAGQGVVG